ncbi:MAG: 2'-5' RNA ligase family protein [Gaiellaceae bacterium MAG52_C11]|nr:2'-5' RNA ligase family protein [Candidatus Gaiellasilicea maunaloa]
MPVPTAEPVVSAWRARYDASAAEGMPAHITALYPFLDQDQLTDSVMAQLCGLCARLPALDVEFARMGRFPAVLYLAPEPAESLLRLTSTIAEQWPESPPYRGSFDEVIPHLTIADGIDDGMAAGIGHDLRKALPFRARLEEARLYVFDGVRWQLRARLPFQGQLGRFRSSTA